MDKYLIVGLGNPGYEYENTRHNTGFMVLDKMAESVGVSFEDKRYGYVAETSIKGRKVFLLKPTTYMNLSGNAVRYWLQKENIDQKRLLVVVDDLSIPLGDYRLQGKTITPNTEHAIKEISTFLGMLSDYHIKDKTEGLKFDDDEEF